MRAMRKKKKQVSDVAAANSLDNCEQTVVELMSFHCLFNLYLFHLIVTEPSQPSGFQYEICRHVYQPLYAFTD